MQNFDTLVKDTGPVERITGERGSLMETTFKSIRERFPGLEEMGGHIEKLKGYSYMAAGGILGGGALNGPAGAEGGPDIAPTVERFANKVIAWAEALSPEDKLKITGAVVGGMVLWMGYSAFTAKDKMGEKLDRHGRF